MTPLAPRPPLEAVVFDLDGTLIDSAPGLHMAACAMLADLDLPQPDLATVIGFIGNGVPKLVERCLIWARADPATQPGAVERFMEHYGRDPMLGTTIYPGAQALLAELEMRGLKLGLCTNKPIAPTRAILTAFDLGPFGAVIGGDSLPQRKPDAAPLLKTIADLGADPAGTLYVGDSITDWRTAVAAQVAYAHVTGGYQIDAIPGFAPWVEVDNLSKLSQLI